MPQPSDRPSFALIVPAAGMSTRFGGGRNKLLEPLGGRAVIARTLEAFAVRADVSAIVVATASPAAIHDALAPLTPALQNTSLMRFCPGGASRAESVLNALRHVPHDIEWVAVHDAARPLVSQALIDRTLAAAVEHGAAVPALPVALTIKEAEGPLPARAQRTVPRARLWAMQTPQVMRRDALIAAFESCPVPLEDVTDDAQVLELSGKEVWLVPGDERNIKITTALDHQIAELFITAGAGR